MRVREEFTHRASASFQPPQNEGKKLCHTQVLRHAHLKYALGPVHYTYFGISAGKTKHDKQAGCLQTRQPAARGNFDSASGGRTEKKTICRC